MTTELNNSTSIEVWRKAKHDIDDGTDYRSQLGCVGEPISDAIDKAIAQLPDAFQDVARAVFNEAADVARGNLLDLVNSARTEAAKQAVQEASEYLQTYSCLSSYDIDFEPSDTLLDVAQRGYEHAGYAIDGFTVDVEIDDDALGSL
jgi:hypothetical protein